MIFITAMSTSNTIFVTPITSNTSFITQGITDINAEAAITATEKSKGYVELTIKMFYIAILEKNFPNLSAMIRIRELMSIREYAKSGVNLYKSAKLSELVKEKIQHELDNLPSQTYARMVIMAERVLMRVVAYLAQVCKIVRSDIDTIIVEKISDKDLFQTNKLVEEYGVFLVKN